MTRRGSQLRRTLAVLLSGGALAVVLMLALPGLAMAEPAVAEPAPPATSTTEAAPVDSGATTPPVAEETPVEEQTPAAPVDEGSAPATDDGAGAAPAPPPSESAPVATEPTGDGSTPAPQPVEAAPAPAPGTALPVPPDVPTETRTPAAVLAATTWDAAPQAPVTLPKAPQGPVAAAVAATEPDPAPAAARTEPPAPPAIADLDDFSFDASGQAVQPITPPAPPAPVAFGHEAQPPDNMTVELVAPEGAATGGSSLLAVLAGYILPGSGPAPPATLMMLVLLGLILAAAYAPRLTGSERIWLSGLLGPSTGHGLAVRRPG